MRHFRWSRIFALWIPALALALLLAQVPQNRFPARAAPLEKSATEAVERYQAFLQLVPRSEKTYRLSAEVAGRAMTETSPYTSNVRIDSRFSSDDFVPDGNLGKKVWRKAEWVKFDHHMSGRRAFPEAETKVASFWTASQVYFAFWCRYTNLNIYEGEDPNKERWELWNRDVVEVFINPQPERVNHYYEFEVSPNNQWIDLEIDKDKDPFNDASWDSRFEHATRIDRQKRVWTCEMRIPLRSLGVPAINPNSEWRLNFYRADGPGDDSQRRFISWSTIPEGTSFHVPTRFGRIGFVK